MKKPKRVVNLSVDTALLEEAKTAGTNLSALFEVALREAQKKQRWQKWRDENRKATESMNRYVEKHGLLSDRYRIK